MRSPLGIDRDGGGANLVVFCSVLLLVFTSSALGQLSTVPADDFWITDGESVNALVVTNGRVYVGGAFANVGRFCPFGAEVDLSAGVADFGSASVLGPVRGKPFYDGIAAVAADGQGGWFIGGNFTSVAGMARVGLAHIRTDGTVNPAWNPGVGGVGAAGEGLVYSLLTTNDRLYVGGQFTAVGGAPRQCLAAVDSRTGEVLGWDPHVENLPPGSGRVTALALSGDTLYAGGTFSSVAGVARPNLVAVDVGTGTPTSWNPRPSGPVLTLAVSGTNVYVGGRFTSIGGSFRTNLAAVSSETGLANAWSPNPDGKVCSIALAANEVFVTGDFTHIGGATRASLASVDAESGVATSWNPAPAPGLGSFDDVVEGVFNLLVTSGGQLYVGGSFTNVAGEARQGLAAFDLATRTLQEWNPYVIAGQVRSIAVQEGRAYAAGSFQGVNGVARRGLAAFNPSSRSLADWHPDVEGTVDCLAIAEDKLLLGGRFSRVVAEPRTNLAAIDLASGQVTSWAPPVGLTTPDSSVNAMAVATNTVYIGGYFENVAGQPRQNIAAIGLDGTLRGWSPTVSGMVNALLIGDGVVYLGGTSSQVDGQSRSGLAAIGMESGLVTSFNPSFQPAVRGWHFHALAYRDGALFAAGFGVPGAGDPWLPYLVSCATATPTINWERAPGGAASDVSTWALVIMDGLMYSGAFGAFDPVTGTSGTWTAPVGTGVWGDVRAAVSAGDSLVIGGSFSAVNGLPVSNLALFPPARAARLELQVSGGTAWAHVTGEPDVSYVLQATTNLVNWAPLTTNSGSFWHEDATPAASGRFYQTQEQP